MGISLLVFQCLYAKREFSAGGHTNCRYKVITFIIMVLPQWPVLHRIEWNIVLTP